MSKLEASGPLWFALPRLLRLATYAAVIAFGVYLLLT